MTIISRTQLFITTIILTIELHHAVNSLTVKDIFQANINADPSETGLLAIIRVPRDTVHKQLKDLQASESASGSSPGKETVVRKARDSKYYSDKYATSYKEGDRADRSLKPEDNSEDDRGTKTNTALGKRCITCDSGYLKPSYDRGRDRYDRYYDRDPYSSSSRTRYDPYDRYDRDRYSDRYDDYDREGYRGRNRYSSSSYDRYEPRDRYSDRGVGYDNRGYDYRDWNDNYRPYIRDRYDAYSPYDDYYSRGSGYDNYSSRGMYGRPDYYGGAGGGSYGTGSGGYARGYSYGDRDRYGGYGSGYGSYGSGYGGGYGGSGYGSGGGYGSGYGGSYGGSRSRYPSLDYDSGYRSTSYLYGRPSSTTTDTPKSSDGVQSNTVSPSQGSSSGRSK